MMRCRRIIHFEWLLFLLCLFCVAAHVWAGESQQGALPSGFVYVDRVIPNIRLELRYCTDNNFVGQPIDGYVKPRAILTRPAAEALSQVQNELIPFGLSLKIFDAYRPQRAVDHFVRWASDVSDTRMKLRYYPHVDKVNLFKEGYIAKQSSHSRGSTVDLTIVSSDPSGNGEELDMGSEFDWFGPESRPDNVSKSSAQKAHRMLLQVLMKRHGFEPYPQEWWHFTLNNEPFPDTAFNFPVQ